MKTIINLAKSSWRVITINGFGDFCYVAARYIKSKLKNKANKKADYFELELPVNEAPFAVPKSGRTVYIITASSYYDTGGGQRGAQLARTFNRMGYKTKFFYAYISADPQTGNDKLPLETHKFIDEDALKYIKENVKKDDLFIFESPLEAFEPIIDIARDKGSKIVYENIDNWETSLGNNVLFENTLVKLLAYADVLVGTARPLVKQLREYLTKYNIEGDKTILYLPNAVDDELFCGLKSLDKPSDMKIGEKTFLYYGSLWGEWFEWDLVIDFAKKHPQYAVNLIGNEGGLNHIMKKCPDNIYFLGYKAQQELPAYVQYCDFTLIPFERGKIGDYVSPVKVFEYIAMYSNVISTSLPDIQGYPNVYCGDTVEDWEKIVLEASPVDKEAADIFVADNSWFSRATSIIDALYEDETCLKDNLSIIILNYNNKNVIFKCVNSLLKYKEHYGYKIIVVDNGSCDGSYEMLMETYEDSDVVVCRNDKNGCACGRNLGMTFVDTQYVMFLDSDQWISNKYWLRPYEEVMLSCNDFGASGWAAGFFTPSGSSGKTVDGLHYRGMLPQNLCRNDIGYLGSGGMLMRTSDFNAIGGFDTAYDPTCFEDTDISLKMRDYGKELYYCPYLGVIHLPHQTTDQVFDSKNVLIKKNRDYFISKWKAKNPKLLEYKNY